MSGLLRLRDVTLALQFGIDKAEAEIADGPLPSRRYYFVGRCRAFLGGPVHVAEDARHAFDPDRKIVVVAYAKFGDGNRTADPAAQSALEMLTALATCDEAMLAVVSGLLPSNLPSRNIPTTIVNAAIPTRILMRRLRFKSRIF